jgi:hypothetical protein
MLGRLLRLRAELAHDRKALGAIGEQLARELPRLAAGADRAAHAVVAVDVHRYYTGLESALERVERTFASVPGGGDWHLELLRGAALDIAGARPRILAPEITEALVDVLRFRHFFRHAYLVELDGDKLNRVATRLVSMTAAIDADLERFETFLAEAAAALGASQD